MSNTTTTCTGVAHSLSIGELWPFFYGTRLKLCQLVDGHARILWVLPVTAAVMEYCRTHGHEARERLFDEYAIVPTGPRRPSVG
ncbi:hypothetical protein PV343_11295 [Streptomyces sp. WI03-4A]|uniref:hypothetical protein n=1 Tax=Streptomyces sp. WI03-4A TaxID=3028706 RepID=UPI0029A98C1E|nr:hypothetical protein [Streptomyces sp. WI03-4A]MDX2592838.1 hypothetical protein [Streptomyces sp. WI03-4A]